jgi:hypothetical protein
MDYNDKTLVDYIYKIYNQFDLLGSVYLEEQIFEDAECLEKTKSQNEDKDASLADAEESTSQKEVTVSESPLPVTSEEMVSKEKLRQKRWLDREEREDKVKKGLLQLLSDGHKKRSRDRKPYQMDQSLQQNPEYAVCEAPAAEIDEECGKTIYIDENMQHTQHLLYSRETGEIVQISKDAFLIGKQQEEVDLCIPEHTASRIHARITREEESWYVEDLNSTNGTFKNGLRMNPYEKRKLESGDEIKFGRASFLFR